METNTCTHRKRKRDIETGSHRLRETKTDRETERERETDRQTDSVSDGVVRGWGWWSHTYLWVSWITDRLEPSVCAQTRHPPAPPAVITSGLPPWLRHRAPGPLVPTE